jgi:hypothetical protein
LKKPNSSMGLRNGVLCVGGVWIAKGAKGRERRERGYTDAGLLNVGRHARLKREGGRGWGGGFGASVGELGSRTARKKG